MVIEIRVSADDRLAVPLVRLVEEKGKKRQRFARFHRGVLKEAR